MVFPILFMGLRRGAMAAAGAVVAAALAAPTASHAHELKASATSARTSDQALQSQALSGLASKEIKRGNAYAPIVWMPEAASARFAGSDVSFGLARLNPLVRRGFGLSGSDLGAVVAPVMSMQISPTSSVAFITIVGDSKGAMVAWQLKL